MKLCEAHKKIFGQGGDLAIHGGGPNIFGWGGTGLDGGAAPSWGMVPPIPPMLGTPYHGLTPQKLACLYPRG